MRVSNNVDRVTRSNHNIYNVMVGVNYDCRVPSFCLTTLNITISLDSQEFSTPRTNKGSSIILRGYTLFSRIQNALFLQYYFHLKM